jgi:hypothetical protein
MPKTLAPELFEFVAPAGTDVFANGLVYFFDNKLL